MQLPEDYNAGPMSLQEFNELKSDEESEAARNGYIVKVTRVNQDNQILAQVAYSENAAAPVGVPGNATSAPLPGQSAVQTAVPVAAVAIAAMGAGLGAAVAGPLGAAAGAAAGAALAGAAGAGASALEKSIATAMQDAADAFDVDPKLLAAIAAAESSFNPAIKNPRSTAFGLFQFLDGTWSAVVHRFGAAVGVTESDRADVKAQCLMGAAFLKDNRDFLHQRLNREPTDGECYAAHFFGAGTAARLLSGPADRSAADALGANAQSVINANRSIFMQGNAIRTVGQVTAELTRRVNDAIARADTLLQSA